MGGINNRGSAVEKTSRLHLIDLAGSEIKKQQKPAEAPAEIPATAPAESKGE